MTEKGQKQGQKTRHNPEDLPIWWKNAQDLPMGAKKTTDKTTPRQPSPSAVAPNVPADTRVYAIGDVHGRADLLAKLFKNIAKDSREDSKKDLPKNGGKSRKNILVMLGDLVDRGPDSKGVLELLSNQLPAEIKKGFELIIIKGNHEAMMQSFIRGLDDSYDWLSNGGMETLESYDIDPHDREIDELRAELKQKMPDHHLELLRKMKLRQRIGSYMFVHAGIRPGVALGEQDNDDLMWIRHSFLDSTVDFGFIVVHGHSIRKTPEVRPNRIGIDTGAWMSGRLSALVLEGDERRFLCT